MPIYVPDYPHLDVAQVSLMASFDSRIASNQSIYHLFQRLLQLGRSMKLASVKKRGRWAYSGAANELKLQCHDVGVFPEVKTCSRMSLYFSPEREKKPAKFFKNIILGMPSLFSDDPSLQYLLVRTEINQGKLPVSKRTLNPLVRT